MNLSHIPQPQQHPQRRARQQLSCTHCRSGKLKCNRQHPCDQCVKRSREDACVYLPAPPKKVRSSKSRNSIGNGNMGVKPGGRTGRLSRNTRERIAELEGLVRDLIRSQTQTRSGSSSSEPAKRGSEGDFEFNSTIGTSMSPTETPTPSAAGTGGSWSSRSPEQLDDHVDVNAGMGGIRISNGQTSYSGSTHWETLLDSIEELKIAIDDDEEEEEDEEERYVLEEAGNPAYTSVFFTGNVSRHATKDMLLEAIPSREISERLLWFWFQSDNPMLPAVHKPTFLAEYEQMMENPSTASTTWLALFFSMLALGAGTALIRAGLIEAHSPENDPDVYRKLASEALTLADITKPRKYTIEALAMFTVSLQDRTSQLRLWLSLGVFLRLALRLGYHRDPSHYPFLTPFQAEMRRRLWCLMWSFDVLTSFSIGLPDMIRQIQSDVKLPRNLLDEDFGPDSKEIPPSRPNNEITSISYIITKTSISKVFGRAADLSHQVDPPDYKEVIALDEELERAHEAYPESLRVRGMSRSLFDPSPVIINRFKLELLYLRTKCVLHRRYLVSPKTHEEEESRQACVEAATKMLKYLDEICRAKASGQLEAGHMYNNISSPDFLLSTMIICLELNQISKEPIQTPEITERIQKMREILEMTYKCYHEPPWNHGPPEKAVKALALVLGKNENTGNVNAALTQVYPESTNVMSDYATAPITTGSENAYFGEGYGSAGVYMNSDGMLNFDESSMDWRLLDKMFKEQVQPGVGQNVAFTEPVLDPNMLTNWTFRS